MDRVQFQKSSGGFSVSRRRVLAAGASLAAGGLVGFASSPADAVLRLDITQGNVQPLPIAIPDFMGIGIPDPAIAHGVTQIIASNLQRSGLFAPIDPAAYIEKVSNFDAVPRFADWRAIKAQALVVGRIYRQPDGRLGTDVRLWDVFAGQQLYGQQFATTPDNWRRFGHIISDAVYERLTGDKGYFDTRIVFVDEFGAEGAPGQTPRGDGSGRRQRALPHAR